MDDNQNQDDSQNTDDSSNTDNSGDQSTQDQSSQDNSQPADQASPPDSSPAADQAASPDSAPSADQSAQDSAASTSDQAASSDNSLQWDANTGTWTSGSGTDQGQAQADTANNAGYGETAGADYASSPYAGVNPNTDASGNPTGWNPGAEVSTGNLVPDPNNPGQVTAWAPDQTRAGLAFGDLAGTWAAPTAQAVAAEAGTPTLDQTGRLVAPDGTVIEPTHGAPPFTPGAPVPGIRQAPGVGTAGGPQWRPAGGMGGFGGYGGGGGGAYAGSINVNPNISPIFNNYAGGAGGAGAGRAVAARPTPVRGAGYFGSMASSSPDVWYGLEGPGWGGVNPTAAAQGQPMDYGTAPWHPLSNPDADAINAAMGIPSATPGV